MQLAGNEDKLNALNRRWLRGINARQRVFMTGLSLDGRFVLRICVLSFRTHAEHMERGLADIGEALAEALAGQEEEDG